MSTRIRPAWTLIELLLLMGIVLVLLGLLLPAIQKANEAAVCAGCISNLRAISRAILRHHDAEGFLPQGGTNLDGEDGARPDRRGDWSWAYHTLPHMGHADLHRAGAAQVDATPIPRHHCTSRRRPGRFAGARIDYAGNAGSRRHGEDGTIVRGGKPTLRLADIGDGAAHTLLVGERQLNTAELGRSRDDDEPYNRPGWDGDWEAYRWGADRPARDVHTPGAKAGLRAFGSAHPSGFNAAFADGSVRHVRFGVDPKAWLKACVRDDTRGPILNDF